ncbi:MAG: cytochrome c [Sulfuricurvum sp.]|uniref:c-type cytochrome n=1 Tax=Sulfuricurvum sp. TaxID=2025608 RepID=UPI0026202A1E|nr:cytochrome c [Sulfuricurvum sp.]MDD5160822.1 cytochrome c [Sulfuricurvum sp.]
MKLFWILAMMGYTLLGADGYGIYQKHCMQCHVEMMEKQEVMKHLGSLKAPPMVEVSNRLKENVLIADDDNDVKRQVIVAFIKDYIQNPSVQYSMCHPMAIEKFGIMPSLKGKLSDDERQAVAEWIYDRYNKVVFK